METQSLRASSEQLDALLRELDDHADPSVRSRVRDVVGLLMELHAASLQRALELAGDAALGSPALVTRLADDAIVGPLLVVHGLHPHDPETRASRALERLRPRIAASGCRASIASMDEGRITIRVDGLPRLAQPAAGELTALVETTIAEAAPEMTAVTIEGGEAASAAAPAPPLIQITRRSDFAPATPVTPL